MADDKQVEQKVDLRGIKGQPFLDFSENHNYLERVTLPDEDEAARRLADYMSVEPGDVSIKPIFMRWATAEDTDPDGQVEDIAEFPCWLECPATHPAAVPFWKEQV